MKSNKGKAKNQGKRKQEGKCTRNKGYRIFVKDNAV